MTPNAPIAPLHVAGDGLRFAGHRIVLSGKFVELRKKDAIPVLEAEGATVSDKLAKDTTVFVYAIAGSGDHTRAQKMVAGGASIFIVSEDEFREHWLLPSPDQAFTMLKAGNTGASRLANLLELNRKQYSRGTDRYSTVPLTGRSLAGAELRDVSLCGLHLVDCDLQGANLTQAKYLTQAIRSDFRKVSGMGCELIEASSCDFREADLPKAQLGEMSDCRFQGANLTNARSTQAMTGCTFDGATLDGFGGWNLKLRGCSFDNVSLKEGDFQEGFIEDCSFAGADLRETRFNGSKALVFKNCRFENADFRGATLSHVRFEHCDLTGARFEDAKLSEVHLVDTDACKAKGFDAPGLAKANDKGAAYRALDAAAPTFKNVTIKVTLAIGETNAECILYQFNHSANSVDRQAWLDGEDVGRLPLADAIATIARQNPKAKLDEKTLVVKATKGNVTPSLKPKAFEAAVLAAWREAFG